MSILGWVFNTIGTVIGEVVRGVEEFVEGVKEGYLAYKQRGGSTKEVAADEATRNRQKLRAVNDHITHLRNAHMTKGYLSDQDRQRWRDLQEERSELMTALNQTKEVRAAEKILDSESAIEKVQVDLETTHVLQYNAFADLLGKKCPHCLRQMKIQWKRDLALAGPNDFYWGCTGWYVQQGEIRACSHTEALQSSDFALMTDTSQPEFSISATDFNIILSDPGTENIVDTRLQDLQSDLGRKRHGVELATCPVHGEHMVLRRKSESSGLLDTFFLACPRWLPHNKGCSFIEKLKSGSQLAALLKSETGRGIL